MSPKDVLQAAEDAACLVDAAQQYCRRHHIQMDVERVEDILAIWDVMITEGWEKIGHLAQGAPSSYPRSPSRVLSPRAERLTQIAHLASYYHIMEQWRCRVIIAQYHELQEVERVL